MKIAIVRGKFLNQYEMQSFAPLAGKFKLTAFASLTPYHDRFKFPVIKLPSPMDLPDFPGKMPILNRLFVDAHYLWGLEKALKGFDIAHSAETYYHYTQQCLNAKRRGWVKKVIATVLENIPFNNEGIWGRRGFKRRSREELDHIIALTNKTKQALLAEGADPNKITVIGHGVNTQIFKPSKENQPERYKSTLTIMFSGRLESYKGVYEIIKAARQLLSDKQLQNFALRFVLVGNGSEKTALLSLEEKWGITKFFTHKQVPYAQMPAEYQKADIFVAPSKPRTSLVRGKATRTWQEQYCTALLEAQASGLPIVTTNSGGIPENVADAAVLIPPANYRALAAALKEFILEPRMRFIYAAKARKRAETVHDVHLIAVKLASVYRSLC